MTELSQVGSGITVFFLLSFLLLLLQVFILIVIAVATLIYLGTAGDYFSLSQYATLAPKGDVSVLGRLE